MEKGISQVNVPTNKNKTFLEGTPRDFGLHLIGCSQATLGYKEY